MLSVLMFFATCNMTNVNEEITDQVIETIMKPSKDIDIPFLSFRIDASQEQKISVSTGTEIEIPANVFVDENQNPVKDVSIKFKEIRSLADIILSGITMAYDSAGVMYDFETAGMFDIRGTTPDGKPIFLKDGKQIKIHTASNVKGDYNLYKLEENGDQKGWGFVNAIETKNKEEIDENTQTDSVGTMKSSKTLIKPVKFDPANDVAINGVPVDYKEFPELKPLKGATWKYVGKNKTQDQVMKLLGRTVDTRELKMIDKNKMIYSLILTKQDKSIELEISPTLSGKMYQLALKKFNNRQQQVAQTNQDNTPKYTGADSTRMATEAAFVRTASVSGFGIYNYDICYRRNDFVSVSADFEFGNEAEKYKDLDISVFLISPDENRVVRYYKYSRNQFAFDPEIENKLVAILPGNKVAIFNDSDFNNLDIATIKTKKAHTFAMQISEETISEPSDLDAIIGY